MKPVQLLATGGLSDRNVAACAQRIAEMEPWKRLGYSAEDLSHALKPAHSDREGLLIDLDGEIAGALVLRHGWWRGAYIELFAIYPEWQRRGLGRTVLEMVESRRGAGVDNLWLLVSASNEPAQSLYRACGFETVGTLTDLLMAGEDEILMRKRLRPVRKGSIARS